MGIGNLLLGNDAICPYIANNLNDDWHTIDCSTSPENFTGLIKKLKPQNLMIIDAAHINQEPVTIKIIPKDEIIGGVTTHNMPLSYLIELKDKEFKNPPGCLCEEVIRGEIYSWECPLFGKKCTPSTLVGPCMVSAEGACATE